ncbi:MAG: ABC transporter substrate-binding protein [Pseudomonadota bacterium]
MTFARLLPGLLVAAASCAAAAPARLYITTETSAPASMREGDKVIGIGTDKVREIMARSGVTYQIEIFPWKRAYSLAEQRPDGCVYSTARTPERETLFKWVGPTDEGEWVLLGRADSGLHLKTLEDARHLRIGTYHGDARDEFLRARGFLVDPAQNDLINPQKLLLGRIDLWAASLRRGGAVLEQYGWADKIVPLLVFNRVKFYLACNRAVPEALVEKMNAAADAMAKDGTMKRIERKYEHWADPKPVP